jgi:hypothetical protein
MRFYTLSGKLVNKNLNKFLIKWDGKCRSIIQFKVKQFLKPYWSGMIIMEEMPCAGTLLHVDLVNLTLKIAIETNGKQHSSFNSFFHGNDPNKYLKGYKNDVKKSEWLAKNDFKLIEINEDEIDLLSKEFFKNKFDILL